MQLIAQKPEDFEQRDYQYIICFLVFESILSEELEKSRKKQGGLKAKKNKHDVSKALEREKGTIPNWFSSALSK